MLVELAAATVSAALSAGLCRVAVSRLHRPAGVPGEALIGTSRWRRSNFAGRPVTLGEGPAVVAGSLVGLLIRAVFGSTESVSPALPRQRNLAVGVAVLGAGLIGGYDDLYGSAAAKGFRGHLRALRGGELTSGTIKIAGVGVSSLAAALIARPGATDLVINTAVNATGANLVNLCDLRPGRALKVAMLLGALAPGAGAAPLLGAVAGALPSDLAGRSMLGDCGANALGAGLAAAASVVAGRPRGVRLVLLAVLVGLNLASERYSFSAVIEAHPVLRTLDRLGRPEASRGPSDEAADPDETAERS